MELQSLEGSNKVTGLATSKNGNRGGDQVTGGALLRNHGRFALMLFSRLRDED